MYVCICICILLYRLCVCMHVCMYVYVCMYYVSMYVLCMCVCVWLYGCNTYGDMLSSCTVMITTYNQLTLQWHSILNSNYCPKQRRFRFSIPFKAFTNVRCTERGGTVSFTVTTVHIIILFLHKLTNCKTMLCHFSGPFIESTNRHFIRYNFKNPFTRLSKLQWRIARDKPSNTTFQPTGNKFEVFSRRVSFWHENELLRLAVLCLWLSLVYYNGAPKLHFITFKGKVSLRLNKTRKELQAWSPVN